MATPSAAEYRAERTFLGKIGEKEYYFARYTHRRTGVMSIEQVEWRIPDIREAVQAPPGYRILSSDYSQIEIRLMAYLSQDPGLIAALNSGKDIHCFIAETVYGEQRHFTYDEIYHAIKHEDDPRYDELTILRSDIKTVTFGVPYGAGPARVAGMIHKTKEEAAKLIDDYFLKYPVLKQWTQKQGRDALALGYTSSPLGRKRFYTLPPQGSPDAEKIEAQIRRWAGNQPIQSGNVDMLKPALAAIYQRMQNDSLIWPDGYNPERARILFVVHDEIAMMALDELAPMDKALRPGPVEAIMIEEMQRSYDHVISGIINKIDVGIDSVWTKH